MATCLFREFTHAKEYLERTVGFFDAHAGLEMDTRHPFGGTGNHGLPCSAEHQGHLLAGEQAGFQDALAGLGMRYAMRSGIVAARSMLEGRSYEAAWRRQLLPAIREGISNRLFYEMAGDSGRRVTLRRMALRDPRAALARLYRRPLFGRLLYPLPRRHGRAPEKEPGCCENVCTCVRCRCTGHG